MNSKLLLPCFIYLTASLPFENSASAQQEPKPKLPLIGKWQVTSDNSENIRNHTYEFLAEGTCIEKYRSWQLAGPIDMPPQDVEMDAVITYRYKALGGKRYRLFPVRSTFGGRPTHGVPTWHVIEVTITKRKAVVQVVARQITEMEKVMSSILDDAKKSRNQPTKSKAKSRQGERQTWVKVL